MTALTRASLAILIALAASAALGDDAAPPAAPQGRALRTKQTLGIGRLFDKLLGRSDDQEIGNPENSAEMPRSENISTQSESQALDDRDATTEGPSPGSDNASMLRPTAAATPTIQVESPLRLRLLDNRTQPSAPNAGPRPQSAASAEDAAMDNAAMDMLDEAERPRSNVLPAAPQAPIITAKPAPPPKFLDTPSSKAVDAPSRAPRQNVEAGPSKPASQSRVARSSPTEQDNAENVVPVAATRPARPSTSSFLADDVRFGKVVRRPQSAATPELTSDIIPESVAVFRTAEPDGGARQPDVAPSIAHQPLLAEDFAPLETLKPRGSAMAGPGQPAALEGAVVSPDASPGQILKALHFYGSPSAAAAAPSAPLSPTALPPSALPPSPSSAPQQPTPAGASLLEQPEVDSDAATREL